MENELQTSTSAIVSPLNSPKDNSSSVQVAVRVRPFLASEGRSDSCLEPFPNSLRIGGPDGPRFSFDRVFAQSTTQEEVFKFALPLLEATLEGYNATILAYG